jgi:hypothetical protein
MSEPLTPPRDGVVRRRLRAVEYRDREADASQLAEASELTAVREKHERAAARWAELAELAERESVLLGERWVGRAAKVPAQPAARSVLGSVAENLGAGRRSER